MCGIAGITGKNVKLEWIHKMTNALKHRGPDDEGYLLANTNNGYIEERIGDDSTISGLKHIMDPSNQVNLLLGHRRLSILDPSPAGHQPMEYNGHWIIHNGEIYNYIELRDKLKKKGYKFNTNTDTEVILAAYKEWGYDCINEFNGMWAFVIYDVEKRILFGSRDRFGVKPLYYINENDVFAFASEIKALLTLNFINRIVNEKILYDYLLYGILEHSNETFFEGILKLMPSHNFVYDLKNKKLMISRYFDLKYTNELGKFSQSELEKHKKNVRRLIEKAVNIRLRSDVPVGSCLSGGIDSSSIVLIINEILKKRHIPQIGELQKVFSACYNDSKINECHYAEKIVNKAGTEWYRVFPESEDLLKDLENLIYIQDEPFGSTSIYAQYKVIGLAKENNVKVLLDGQGGDELFTGYKIYYISYFFELFKNLNFLTLIKEIKHLKNSPISLKELIYFIAGYIFTRLPNYLKLKVYSSIKPELKYINNKILKKYYKVDTVKDVVSTTLNNMCYYWMTNYNLQHLLRYEDRNSMAHSIEARTPFSDDIELIEYVFSVPSVYKIHNGWSKFLLRVAMKDLLPEDVKYRKDKIGFATPERRWITEIKDELKELINFENPYIDAKRLIEDFDELIKKLPESGLTMLWRLINVILWMKIFNVQAKT